MVSLSTPSTGKMSRTASCAASKQNQQKLMLQHRSLDWEVDLMRLFCCKVSQMGFPDLQLDAVNQGA
jgi:hypothetical protein